MSGEFDTHRPPVVSYVPGRLILHVLGSSALVAAGVWLIGEDEPIAR